MNFRTENTPASIASAHSARADLIARIDPHSRVLATSAKQARADALDAKVPAVPASAKVARAAFVARITNPKE